MKKIVFGCLLVTVLMLVGVANSAQAITLPFSSNCETLEYIIEHNWINPARIVEARTALNCLAPSINILTPVAGDIFVAGKEAKITYQGTNIKESNIKVELIKDAVSVANAPVNCSNGVCKGKLPKNLKAGDFNLKLTAKSLNGKASVSTTTPYTIKIQASNEPIVNPPISDTAGLVLKGELVPNAANPIGRFSVKYEPKKYTEDEIGLLVKCPAGVKVFIPGENISLCGKPLTSINPAGTFLQFTNSSTQVQSVDVMVGASVSTTTASGAVKTNLVYGNTLTFPLPVVSATVQPALTLLAPNGGETLKVGDRVTVKWSSRGIPESAQISLYAFKGNKIVYSQYVANTGSVSYQIPNVSGNDFKLGLLYKALDGKTYTDNSDYNMTVVPATSNATSTATTTKPAVQITFPSSDVTYVKGVSTSTIAWKSHNLPASFKFAVIRLVKYQGDKVYNLAYNVVNDEVETLKVPALIPAGKYTLEILGDYQNKMIKDAADGVITVVNK